MITLLFYVPRTKLATDVVKSERIPWGSDAPPVIDFILKTAGTVDIVVVDVERNWRVNTYYSPT